MAESSTYLVAMGQARYELREKGSRFLALVESIADQESARARVKAYQQEYRDASHVCWAWRTGSASAEGCSDAGEPAGTAGMPMLQVLRGAEVSDVLAVVVRWFGGTKLGKGGLARAYAGAVKGALKTLTIEATRAVTRLRVSVPYGRVGDVKRLVHPPEVEIVDESYGEQAEILLRVDRERADEVCEILEGFATEVVVAGSRSAGRNRLDEKNILIAKEERSS